MKIVKEVIIKASISDSWSWLIDGKILPGLPASKNEEGFSFSDVRQAFPGGRVALEPPRKISFESEIASSIIVVLELHERGQRTGLKVTISGWETIDPQLAKMEMPRISLSWERKLSLIKREIEAACPKSAIPRDNNK